jgi:hypothetical protein
MVHIILDINSYIDTWLKNQLVHDIYLKTMGAHFQNLSAIFLFFINKLLQVSVLVGAMDVSP